MKKMCNAFFLVFFGLSLINCSLFKEPASSNNNNYIVNTEVLIFRKEPSTNSSIIGKLKIGEKVNVIKETDKVEMLYGKKSKWVQIVTSNGKVGYVFSAFLKKVIQKNDNSKRNNLNKIFNELCRNCQNSLECAQAIETFQINNEKVHFSRKDEILELKIFNGHINNIINEKSNKWGQAKVYHYREFLPKLELFVVHVQYYEGDGYLLVDAKTGTMKYVWGLPIGSPDNDRFIVISEDLDAGYKPNLIQIWRRSSNGFYNEWDKKFEEVGPLEAAWINKKKLKIVFARLENGVYEKSTKYLFLNDAKKDWFFE